MPHVTKTAEVARKEASLADQAYYMVRERILRGRFCPGTVLCRRKLAGEFGMSLVPIAEALQRLESEGLVESQPRVGTRVRTPGEDEIRGRYVVREALEAESAKLCCLHASFQERMELRRLGDQLDTLFARVREREDDRDLFYAVQENHTNLHLRIAECSRCVQLKKAIEQNHVLIYNWFFDSSTRGRFLPPRFHQDLMEKVTGDDPDAAEEAMRLHVRFGLASVVEQLAGTTASSDWRRKRKEPQ